MRPPPSSPLFPYTTLFRSPAFHVDLLAHPHRAVLEDLVAQVHQADRKSTRLNSSHVAISYAVFCLKKKKRTRHRRATARGPPTPFRYESGWRTRPPSCPPG